MVSDRNAVHSRRQGPDQRDQLAVDAIPKQVWRARPDGALEFVNRQWLEYTGLSMEQSAG